MSLRCRQWETTDLLFDALRERIVNKQLMTWVDLYPKECCQFSPQPADHTPSGRGVCLLFSSCPGPLTTMTGSELAGHRLPGSARRVVLRTTLLARRGGTGPPLKRPPPPGASRLLAHTFGVHAPVVPTVALRTCGAQTPFLRNVVPPLRGGQCRAIGRGWGETTDRTGSNHLKHS